MKISSRLLVGLLLLASVPVAGRGQEDAAPPRLILILSIDQMRADYLTRFDDLFEGGFRTLLDRGAVFTNAMYRHAVTETGPGHSVILSGRHPSSSGIVGNAWFDPLLDRSVNVIEDPFVSLSGAGGRGASPVNLVGFTLGDVLKRVSPESKVVGVSMKDRSAILMGGRLGDAAFWYDPGSGSFISSSWYMEQLPEWLNAWNERSVADSFAGTPWTRLIDDASIYERFAGADDIEGEWDREDTVFPHAIRGEAGEPAFYADLRRTPFADEITGEVALAALGAYELGSDDATDLFAVGFSGSDYIGHTYGPDSQEVMDQYLRLDLLLAGFLGEIEQRVGLDRTLIVLTADHGAMPLVEVSQTRGLAARRVDPRSLRDRVMAALGERYENPQALIASFGSGGVYFDRAELSARGILRRDVEAIVSQALLSTIDVAAVYTREQLAGSQTSDDPYLWLYRNSFFPARSPDLAIRLHPYLYPSSEYAGGTGHGTPYDYDRHVPLIVMGQGIPPSTFVSPAGPEDIAPTLAAILGLDFPREPDARVLEEILP